MSKCDERFARQYRYEPPPGFPLASPSSDIVHHLSGPNRCAYTQTSLRKLKSVVSTNVNQNCRFHSAHTDGRTYSHTCVDSLVRVSRRVIRNLLVPISKRSCTLPRQPNRRGFPKEAKTEKRALNKKMQSSREQNLHRA